MAAKEDGAMVQPRKQALTGAALLIVGCLVAVGIVEAGLNVLASVGAVLAVVGLVLIVNGLVSSRREGHGRSGSHDDSFDSVAVVALVLAFLLPPVGLLLGAYRPVEGRPGQRLYALAIAVGVVLTVVYTLLLILGAGLIRTSD